jgi:hypothetical protein
MNVQIQSGIRISMPMKQNSVKKRSYEAED